MIKNVTAVILAGGKSIRMGFDKQFLKTNEEFLIKKNTEKLLKIFEKVTIISNDLKLEDLKFSSDISIYPDIIKGYGPLGGIYTALERVKTDYIYVLACDMPNINKEYIRYIVKINNKNIDKLGVVTEFGDWIEPFNGLYSIELKDNIKKYLISGRRSIFGFIRDKNFYYIKEEKAREFDPKWDMFENFNTTADLLRRIII